MLIVQLIILQVITFIGLVFVLRKFLYTEAASQIKRLKSLNADNEKKAEDLRKKVEQAEAEYKEKTSKAEEEARRIKEEAQREIGEQRLQAEEKANLEAERIISQARNSREKIKEELKVELEEEAIDFAFELIRAAFDEAMCKNVHEELANRIIDGLEQIEGERIPREVATAEITSAFNLSPQQKERIRKIISKKVSREIDLKEEMNRDLIAGLIIRVDDLIIDGSLFNRLKETRQSLEKGA